MALSTRFTEADFGRDARMFLDACNSIVPAGCTLPREWLSERIGVVEAAYNSRSMPEFRRSSREYLDGLREFVRGWILRRGKELEQCPPSTP